MNLNNYICTGRLTRDPELRALPSGTSVCELRLAVDGMGRNHEVGYINVNVYGSRGEAAAKHLAQGWKVAFHGRLEFAEWDGKDGKRHDYTAVGVVEFLTAPRAREEQQPTEAPAEQPAAA
jgi:single-strand DNA-binding protein